MIAANLNRVDFAVIAFVIALTTLIYTLFVLNKEFTSEKDAHAKVLRGAFIALSWKEGRTKWLGQRKNFKISSISGIIYD